MPALPAVKSTTRHLASCLRLAAIGTALWSVLLWQSSGAPWFQNTLVGMEIGPTGAQLGYSDSNDVRYCSRFDGRQIVRRALAAHSEYLVLWVRDGDYAYYNSKLLPKAPGLGERDPLREALEEAQGKKLPIIAYCVVQQGGHFLKAHPEWEMRGADGKPLGRFCYTSGYLEAMKALTAEQLAYDIQGFHIDMLDQGFGPPYGCWCQACQQQFEKEYGRAMPKGLTWDENWELMLEFRYRSSERFMKALHAHVKSIKPLATVDFNYHGNPPFSFEVGQRPVQHACNGDFITGETGVWGFSALTVGLNAAFYHAAAPDQRVQVAMQRGVRMYHDQTTRPLHDLRWELFTLLAHGAFVTVVDKTGFDGWLDPVAYDRIGHCFAEALAKRAHFGHRPMAEVGLYFSSRTRDWLGREKPADYFQSFLGAHKAMVYEHIPFGVVLDENASLETLARFPIVMLPNTAILSERELTTLQGYVERGGKLLVTGQSGLFGRRGEPRSESSLRGLIGAKLKRRLDSLDNWVLLPPRKDPLNVGMGKRTRADVPGRFFAGLSEQAWPFLVKGPASVYETTSATSIGELYQPHRTTRQLGGKEDSEGREWPMSPDTPVGPAILVNPIGQGVVLTLACSPDFATASEHHIPEARKLLRDAVRFLNPTPRLEITAPPTVETVVTDDSETRTLRVHLLGYNSPPQTTPPKGRPFVMPALIETPPSYQATIRCSESWKSVKAINRTTVLRQQGNRVEVFVKDIHEVVSFRY